MKSRPYEVMTSVGCPSFGFGALLLAVLHASVLSVETDIETSRKYQCFTGTGPAAQGLDLPKARRPAPRQSSAPQATTAPLPRSHGLRASPPLGPGAPVQERKVTRECSETVVQEHTATALTSRAELCGAVKRRSARRRRQAILNDTFTRSVHPIHRPPGNGLLPSHSVASLARCSCGG